MTDQIIIEVPSSEWLSANGRDHWAARARRTKALRLTSNRPISNRGSTLVSRYNGNGPEECANIPRGLTTSLDLGKEWL